MSTSPSPLPKGGCGGAGRGSWWCSQGGHGDAGRGFAAQPEGVVHRNVDRHSLFCGFHFLV